MYRDGDTATERQQQKAQLNSFGLDWRGERARLSADLYNSEDRVRGQNRGISLAANVAVPKPPKSDTLLNPDWAFVDTKDQGAIVRGEFDLTEQLLAYAAFGASETHYRYSGAMSAQVINNAGDLKTSMGQLKMDIEKTSGEAGSRANGRPGRSGHQWVVNATRYADKQKDYGRRWVPGADWLTNIYHPTWGPGGAAQLCAGGTHRIHADQLRRGGHLVGP